MSLRPLGSPNVRLAVALTVALSLPLAARGQIAGESVNMVSGTGWPGGDPFLQRQNEPSIAVSSANPQHLLAGANDYRTVDLPNPNVPDTHGDAWLGVFKSFDGGQTWQSVLLPGYPQDTSPAGLASPLHGFTAASDPLVRAGTNGMLYYSGIVFNRGTNLGRVFVARFIDLNNKENGDATVSRDPIQYLDGTALDGGTSGQFLDKPWLATDIPRAGAGTCTIPTTPPRSFPAGNVYFAYAVFTGNSASPSSKIMFTLSRDCGKTWSTPIKLSESNAVNQGTTLAVDPVSGAIHLVWRRFATGNQTDALLYAKSTDFGKTFSKGQVLFDLGNPFDQDGATGAQNFRSEAFPTLAVSVDASGTRSWVHLAWAQRSSTTGDAQVVMSTSTDGTTWGTPVAVDTAPLQDDAGNRFARGHQFMPQLTFTQGQLMLLYYDSRLDHTAGWFTPYADLLPDSQGRFYTEQRAPLGELLSGPSGVFTPFIDDALLTQRRHTIDVRVAQASPGSSPTFSSTRVSNFLFGGRGDERPGQQVQGFTGSIQVADANGLLRLQQLQFNPPNLPLFAHGTIPFIGDYIDIAGPAFVAKVGGGWAFNTAPTASATHYAVWTSNQDVRPPPDGDWTKYTPPFGAPSGPGGTSLFDSTQLQPTCQTGYEGTRNQNVYSARISNGLLISSPQNAKPLASTLTRAFVVAAANATSVDRAFRFSATATGVVVSFTNGLTGGAPLLPAFDVVIPSQSTVHRSVFARLGTATDPGTSIAVRVDEVDPSSPVGCLGAIPPTCKLVAGGLSGFLTLNPPGMVAGLAQPDGSGADIQTIELYTPTYGGSALDNTNFSNTNFSNTNFSNTNLSNTNLSNTNFSNTNLSNSSLAAAHVSNAEITNLSNTNLSNTNFSNTNFSNTNLSNTNFSNTNLSNTNLSNAALSDANYVVTNTGNTTHSYHVKIVGNVPATPLQLILSKNYTTPLALGCMLVEQPHPVVIASVDDIRPAIQPLSAPLADPNIPDPSGTNATLALAPGESAVITLRGLATVDGMKQIVSQLAPVTVPHAGGSFAAALLVASDGTTLPTPKVGVGYSATLQAIGGTGPYTWTFVSGTLPSGLSLSAGQILGTPTSTGSFTFTVQVADRSQPTNTAQRSITLNVGAGPTTTTLAASPSAPVFGQPVTLTATVSAASSGSGAPLPSGTVTFQDGGATLGTASLQGGSASLTVPGSLSVGSHSFSATYGGDSSYAAGGTSSPIASVVGKAQVSVAVVSSASPSFFGQSVAWTATVSAAAPGAGTPTGVVTFSDGGTVVGTSTLAAGVATFTPTALQTGTHSVSASYGGDGSFLGDSGALSQVVNPASTSIALSSSSPSTAYGLPVTFTATLAVTAGAGTPTGTITFTDGGASIGTGTLSSGVASFTTSTLGAGAHQITAVFGGDGSFGGSTSGVLVEAVATASTATSVTSSLTPSTFGQSVTFTATVSVSQGAGTPDGAVTFTDGGATIGTGTLNAGVATLVTSSLVAGPHQITAVYGGASNFGTSTSGFILQTVGQASTTTGLSSSPSPSTFGQSVTFTATVTSSAGVPGGSVTFSDSGTTLGSAAVNGSGVAIFTTTALPAGTHGISATFGASGNFASSSTGPLAQVVGQATTTTTLASLPNPSTFGQPVTLTATVTSGAGSPTGTVTFLDGGAFLGTGTVAGGVATITTQALAAATHSITASYGASGNFGSSASSPLAQVVGQAGTATTLASSLAPATFGQSVTFTATVTSGAGIPTGTVTFFDGAAVMGTGALTGGVASFSTAALGAGTHAITAAFGANGNFGSSTSGPLAQVVAQATPVLGLVSSPSPSSYGQAVTFTATVSSGSGTPVGTVTFTNGGASLGTVALSSGVATLTSSSLAAGTHQITAVYGGGGNFAPATSGYIVQTVSKATTSTTLSSSLNPSTYGQAVTFKVKVASSVGIPTGTVTFTDSGTALGTATLDATGTATFSTTALLSGTHAIVASYAGDRNFTGSVSGTLSQGVGSLYTFTGFYTPLATAGTPTSPSYSGTQNFGKGLPVKWSLQDAKTGTVISAASSLTSVQAIANPACVGPPLAGASVLVLYSPLTGATGGSSFKFSTNQFAFTWDTSTAPGRGCYNLVVKLNDGTQKATIVNLQ